MAVLIYLSTRVSRSLIYTLDDAYIHMATAKHFAESGVWGITKFSFSSVTSSPLWTLLLSAAYFITGSNIYIPFILNVLFSCLTITAFYFILRSFALPEKQIFVFMLLLIFSAPLPALTYMGMEHIMQIFFVLVFSFLAVKVINGNSSKDYYYLLIISPLMVMTRYETASLAFIVFLLLLFKKKIKYSILLGILTVLPVAVYGIISINNGGYFFPNSVLVKAGAASINLDFTHFLRNRFIIFSNPMIVPIIISLVFITAFFVMAYFKLRHLVTIENKNLALIFIFAAASHLIFAKIENFFRYEAYLAALFILILALNYRTFISSQFRFKKPVLILLILIISFPLSIRTIDSFIRTPKASQNIYHQQYQMALFVKTCYNNSNIVLNDIGFVNYLSDIRLIDLYGLGDIEVIKLRSTRNYNTNSLRDLVLRENGSVAIIYDAWFPGLGDSWTKVEEWTIPDNVVCGDEKVSFYAVNPSEIDILTKKIKKFNKTLPQGIKYTLQ